MRLACSHFSFCVIHSAVYSEARAGSMAPLEALEALTASNWHAPGRVIRGGASRARRAPVSPRGDRSERAAEQESIADADEGRVDSAVAFRLAGQLSQGDGVDALVARIGDFPAPEHVVADEDPAGPEQRERELVVGAVVLLIGVDEPEVVGASLALLDSTRE